MEFQVSVRLNDDINDIENLVDILHADYIQNRMKGYKGTPYDYVKSASLTFPNIQKLFTYENVCKLIDKRYSPDGYALGNFIGEISYFSIILAINHIIIKD